MMDDCDRFENLQLLTLLEDTSSGEKHWADLHARGCEVCRSSAGRDRWLSAAFVLDRRAADKGFSGAHRKIESAFRDHRALCCRVEGPFGPVFLARTPHGVCRVSFRRSKDDFMRELENCQLLPEFAPPKLTREVRELEDYFSGRTKRFRLPLDMRLVTSQFQQRVLEATARIPFGEVASYSDIAHRIGQPAARRAVGGALGRNPVAIVVPCHRVIASNGSIGGYTGGLDIKRKLMQIEGISLEEEQQ